jgi:ribulose-phosphate 3-epimerase
MSPRVVQIAPSILAADFFRLGEQVTQSLESGVRRIHIDVMDGQFVPNITMGPLVVEALRPLAERFEATLEVHLMIQEPDRYLSNFSRAGAAAMTVHLEACPHLHRTVHTIRSLNAQPGVALNPATPLVLLDDILPEIDVALLMSVDPGFGGQKFIASTLDKVTRLRTILYSRQLQRIEIEVDGGIDESNISDLTRAGMTIAVAGTSVFNSHRSITDYIRVLQAACSAA